MQKSDFLIIGAGIIGLSIAKTLQEKYPNASINIIEKELEVGLHASGRNSGVLHAGFYYTSDSLKAKFTKEGNSMMKAFCDKYGLALNSNQKVVIAQNEDELKTLYELEARGKANGVDVKIIDEDELIAIEPNAKTYKKALYSPTTATINPKEVITKLAQVVVENGASLHLGYRYTAKLDDNIIETNLDIFQATTIINTAGLYADKIAHDFGVGMQYTILPFKGIYLKYSQNDKPIKTNIYPVPNLKNPFLGVHYTVTVDNTIKIGPTAIPAFWRENYKGFDNFNAKEMAQILQYEAKLFISNSFGFRNLAFEEFAKYSKNHLANLAKNMLKDIDSKGFDTWSIPGIRAQLLHKKSLELVQDFVVEKKDNTIHILNAVSPAFTCSFAFASWVVNEYVQS
jgi:L-2-hydroxyglutarate oxidase LhgO